MSIGYIYIRTNEYWDIYDACKLGKTVNIPDRENNYITSELKRGTYEMVLEVNLILLDDIEDQLQIYFNDLNFHIKFNAGVEFYKKEIINFIIPWFDDNEFEYKILSREEIDELIRIERPNDILEDDYIPIPREYQQKIIDKVCEYFLTHDKGLLVVPCGVGKTLISLWITQALSSHSRLKVIIGVPNILLLKQWQTVTNILFPDTEILLVYGNIDVDEIASFLENNPYNCIVITTYSSSHKVFKATKQFKFTFKMKILDEAHHLTSNNMELNDTKKTYIQMLIIPSKKQLSLTATLKQMENSNDNIIANDNIEYFGEIIERKSLLWAIEENIICDYIVQTIVADDVELEEKLLKFNITAETDKRLFLGAYTSLKSIADGFSHHLLIYSNSRDNSNKIIQYIQLLLDNEYFNIPDLYFDVYHSEMKVKKQARTLELFELSKYGIISCVYCLGEGYDNSKIDAVVFSENMTSNIRIVQSALRASRKNKNEPNKITKIILPVLNKDRWLDDSNNSDLKKVKQVIYQLGLEDELITQKIKVSNIKVEKYSKTQKIHYVKSVNDFGDYDEELTRKLRLNSVKRSALGTSYEKARKILKHKNIKSKEEYYKLCEIDNRLPSEPEVMFKGRFTSWIEFLNIERIYYDIEMCTKRINELITKHKELKKYYLDLSLFCIKLCELDDMFPPNGLWVDYYGVKELCDVITINNKKKKTYTYI